MVHAIVSKYVVPFPMTSRIAVQFFRDANVHFDLIHIDAAHEYADIKEDINVWLPLLAKCGVMLGDDYSQSWPGVVRAVDELNTSKPGYKVVRPSVEQGGKKTDPLGGKWWLRPRGCGAQTQRSSKHKIGLKKGETKPSLS